LTRPDPLQREGIWPPIKRSGMTYHEFSGTVRDVGYSSNARVWKRQARLRRTALLVLLAIATGFGALASSVMFSGYGLPVLKGPIVAVFSLLFAWVAINCFTTLFGFWLFCRGHDPLNPANALDDPEARISDQTSIAVLLPIYNEDVFQILTGLRVMIDSLQDRADAWRFTFFILSDTQDPDVWVEEEAAWQAFCEERPAYGRVVYRHRKSRVGRKSGNIADFCRRWGQSFTYMIILDSDSLLDGRTMVQLATIMDRRSDIGILQTTPQNFHAKTLLARLQQFASQAYGPLFIRGLHFWQLGDAAYWGHNAIIRVAPFMTYCSLPKPHGRGLLGGMILSHDSIEAALMRRAGWGVWLAYDLSGSFEQPPSTLITETARDARWCRGNFQHLRYLGLKGLTLGHRWLFINGNLFYGASFLWMLLIFLITANSVAKNLWSPNFFPTTMSLFPDWPVQHRDMAFVLLGVTFTYLFLPKCLAVMAAAADRKTRVHFGGLTGLIFSTVFEFFISSLMAPLRMILHSYHVLTSLLGRRFDWQVSSRSAASISWTDALKLGGVPTLMGLVAAYCLYHFDRTLFAWTSVVSIPLLFSIPLAMFLSRADLGERFRKWGLLRVPTESDPSPEVYRYESLLTTANGASRGGFVRAVVDPKVHALHLRLLRKPRHLHSSVRSRRRTLAEAALRQGPRQVSSHVKREILYDPELLERLHNEVSSLPKKAFALWDCA
jgi:membrane glycosyltransferase